MFWDQMALRRPGSPQVTQQAGGLGGSDLWGSEEAVVSRKTNLMDARHCTTVASGPWSLEGA